ncbi:MAG: hypothetical protein U0599_08800 [Vicinamibacteria bacterium]
MSRYDEVRFRATHNSYSGGARGSVPDQLDAGCRLVELDVHARGFAEIGDFRVGHLKPGAEVSLGGGNPDSLRLRDWLAAVARWSDAHVHAPITVVLDSKDDLLSPSCGSPEDLNRIVEEALGPRLFTPADLDAAGGWPDLTELTSRVLCVLSGNGNTRLSYRWAFGAEPALATNARGDAVLVYVATSGDLHAFAGEVRTDGAIAWQSKSSYRYSALPLSQPAVAVNDEGWIVAAHRFVPPEGFTGGTRLESLVGRIGADRRVSWFGPGVYGIGSQVRLAIEGTDVVEWHVEGGVSRQRRGVLNTRRGQVRWGSGRRAEADPPAPDSAIHGGRTYRCATDDGGAVLAGPEGGLAPARFRPVLFVEEQKGDDRGSVRDALFFAADAKDRAALDAARARGQVVRAWGVEEADLPCPAQIAATDAPRAAWYEAATRDAVA